MTTREGPPNIPRYITEGVAGCMKSESTDGRMAGCIESESTASRMAGGAVSVGLE